MSLYENACWLDLNGWGEVEGASEDERSEECRRLRMASDQLVPYCAKHGPITGDSATDVVPSR